MIMIRIDVRRKLVQVAKRGKTITYGELMKKFRIPRGHPVEGIGIGWVVGEISEHEDSEKRPLLSAIVVRSASATRICPKGKPAYGFFRINTWRIPAKLRMSQPEHGNHELREARAKFIHHEQEEVWRYWQTHKNDMA